MFPLRDNIPSSHRPVVNYAIIGLSAVIFLLEVAAGRHIQQIINVFGFTPGRFLALWQTYPDNYLALYLPLFTTMFLHGGWLHLIVNMWSLWIFGDNVEDALGHVRFLILYLAAGVAGSLLHLVIAPESWIPVVGASGAIAGVMGAYLLLFPRSQILVLLPFFFIFPVVEVPAPVFLVVWFVLQFFSGAFSVLGHRAGSGGVAFWAHVGGFAAGMLLLILLAASRVRNPFKRYE